VTEVACEFDKNFQNPVMQGPARKILFVCMGNICRSPAAEIVFHHKINEAKRRAEFHIDSAGTIGLHAGNPPDHRMSRHLTQRGYKVFGTSRPIVPEDLSTFDLILVMDDENERDVRAMDPMGHHAKKIRNLTDYATHHQAHKVPDPYYGGDEGFAMVIDLIEDSCSGLLQSLS
jgi:protein-tyrosine phosphatase